MGSGRRKGRKTQTVHAKNLRVHAPWWTCRSGVERSTTPAVASARPPKKRNPPRETRVTARAPNHAGEGSTPTAESQDILWTSGSA